MSKSIYEAAANILRDSLQDPQGEDNDCYVLNLLQMNVIAGAILKAQKQEKQGKLLELYKRLNNIYENFYTMELSKLSLDNNYYEIEIIKLKQQIKEL